ncbi:MAG TPA: glycosyl hydrolase 108 family protein [Phycisphaerae bacterium]|nr:glycosyl hydrolase 108 family protein [Phycisphaerae bacterium]
MTFDEAFDRLLGHEGGLSLDPKDSGNWTGGVIGEGELRGSKYGISAASFPELDIANVTPAQAKAIFRTKFWDKVQGDKLVDGVAWQLSDTAYHSGPDRAIRLFQRALGVADDGRFGKVSRAAADAMSETDQIMLVLAERLDFMTRLTGWNHNGRGWARRIAKNLRYGAIDS